MTGLHSWRLTAAALIGLAPVCSFALSVPGTSDPWLAGMPDGATASVTDSAPAQSPVLVPGLDLSGGGNLRFVVSGNVSNGPCCAFLPPDGGDLIGHDTGAENGIAGATAPINALVGVFLDAGRPDLLPPPVGLDFGAIGLGFASIQPELRQVFFIGDGLSGAGNGVQRFGIPTGATRLFLGTMDGVEWINNLGAFEVAVTHDPSPIPEPDTAILHLCGIAVLWHVLRRRRAQ